MREQATDVQECLMNIRATLVRNTQTPVLVQSTQGPLHYPRIHPQPAATLASTPGQHRDDSQPAQDAPVTRRIISPVPVQPFGTSALWTRLATDGRDGGNQGKQLVDVVLVGRGHLRRQGNAVGIGDDMVLAARFAPIRRIGAGLVPPKTARTEAESITARDQSILSAWRKWLRRI